MTDLLLEHAYWHWRILGDGMDGPHEGRAIALDGSGNGKGSAAAALRTWPEVEAFLKKWHGKRMVCISVQPCRHDYDGGKHASAKDHPCVTNIFLDFDCKVDPVELMPIIARKLQRWTDERGMEPFVIANSGRGIHAYAAIEPIWVDDVPDIGERLVEFQSEVRDLLRDVKGLDKIDSVADLPRVVKLIGTRKMFGDKPGPLSAWARAKPSRCLDDNLREYLLAIELDQTKEVVEAQGEEMSDAIHTRELIEGVIASSSRLKNLREQCAKAPKGKRSSAEFSFTRELWMRGIRDAQAIALTCARIPGSKSSERGLAWAIKKTKQILFKLDESGGAPQAEIELIEGDWIQKASIFVETHNQEIDWLYKPYLAQQTVRIKAGDPKSYKTFQELDEAIAVAAADPKNTVFYIGAEGGASDWSKRITGLAAGRGVSLADIPFYFSYKPKKIDLSNRETLLAVRQSVLDLKPVLVVADSLRATLGGDENDSKVISALFDNIDWICEDLPAEQRPSWSFIHHLRKPSAGQKDVRPALRLRGSTQLWAGPDTITVISKEQEAIEARPKVKVARSKMETEHRFDEEFVKHYSVTFHEEGAIAVRYFEVPTDWDAIEEKLKKRDSTTRKQARSILKLLCDDEPRSIKAIRAAVKGKAKTIGETLTDLRTIGAVIQHQGRPKTHTLDRTSIKALMDAYQASIDGAEYDDE